MSEQPPKRKREEREESADGRDSKRARSDASEAGSKELYKAIAWGEIAEVRRLLQSDHALVNKKYTLEKEEKKYSRSEGWEVVMPLIHAVNIGQTEIAQLLINAKADVEKADDTALKNMGRLLVDLAMEVGSSELLKILINAKAKVGGVETDPPLSYASKKGNTIFMDLLLKAKAQIDETSADAYDSPLRVACRAGQLEAVKFLLAQTPPPSLEAVGEGNNTPLLLAMKYKKFDIAPLLIAARADVNVQNRKGMSAVILAVEAQQVELLTKLLDAKADSNVQWKGQIALSIAVKTGSSELVNVLLAHQPALPPAGNIPLHQALGAAIKSGHAHLVSQLLEKKADPAFPIKGGQTALHIVARLGENHIIRLLLQDKEQNPRLVALTDAQGQTPLLRAAQNPEALEGYGLLLEAKSDVMHKDAVGQTVLHLASAGGNVAVIEQFIESYSSRSLEEYNRFKPLFADLFPVAAASGSEATLNYVFLCMPIEDKYRLDLLGRTLAAGCKSNQISVVNNLLQRIQPLVRRYGLEDSEHRQRVMRIFMAAIGVASQTGNIDIMNLLLKHYPDGVRAIINDKEGRTALHIASARGHQQLASRLIKAKADIDMPDAKGHLPEKLAEIYGHTTLVEAFKVWKKQSAVRAINPAPAIAPASEVPGDGDAKSLSAMRSIGFHAPGARQPTQLAPPSDPLAFSTKSPAPSEEGPSPT